MSRQTVRADTTRQLNRRQWLQALGAGGVAAVAGCAGDQTDSGTTTTAAEPDPIDLGGSPPPVEGEYHAVQGSSFETINPIFNTEAGAGTAVGYALDMGYTFDHNDNLFPLLFSDIRTEDNGTTWRIELRDNLSFSDPYGQYTATDYVYYVQNIHQADWAPSANSADWQGVEIEQIDKLTARATLPNPTVIWPETFAPLEYPIPQGLLEPYVTAEDVEGPQPHDELLALSLAGHLAVYTLTEWTRDGRTRHTRTTDHHLRAAGAARDDRSLLRAAPYF